MSCNDKVYYDYKTCKEKGDRIEHEHFKCGGVFFLLLFLVFDNNIACKDEKRKNAIQENT